MLRLLKYLKSILNKIAKILFFTTILTTFYFEIAVKWTKLRNFEKFPLEHALNT